MPSLKLPAPPFFFGKKEPGSRRPRGESAVAERLKLHLKGGEQPGVHFELVDMFWECGHFSRLRVPTSRWRDGGGRGGGNSGPDTKLLGSGFWVPLQILLQNGSSGPPSLTSPASLFILGT